MSSTLRLACFIVTAAWLSLTFAACAPGTVDPDSESLSGADEDTASSEEGLSGSVAVGTTLVSITNVNLRGGPSTSSGVLHVVPDGSKVIVEAASPSNGFYKVKHNGTVGWSHGAYYNVQTADDSDPPPANTGARAEAITRAKAGVGFSYYWGHGRFSPSGPTASTKGSCSGSCPDCSHSGSYGGDCSGYVAKVWQVPSSNTSLSTDSHPYSTSDFNTNTSQWKSVSRGTLKEADAMVYRSGGAGHIFIYEKGDAWNSMYAYECKGCAAGCVSGYRTAGSAYKAIRRSGW